jgi:hypothetical protein
MISASDNRLPSLTLLIQQCGFDYPKLSPSEKRLSWKKLQAALIQWQLSTNGSKFTGNRLQFMAYNVYGFSLAEFTAAFPDVENPLPWPLASILNAAPSPAQIAVHNANLALYEAFVSSKDALKFMLEYLFRGDIEHLAHELTGYSNVSCAQLYAAALLAHGRLLAEDVAYLRAQTRLSPDRSLTAEENITLFVARRKRLADVGPTQALGDGETLSLFEEYLSSMAPEVLAIVTKYHVETDTLDRSFLSLLEAARLGLSRLPNQPSLSSYGRANAATADDSDAADLLYPYDDPTAFAAVQPSKGGWNRSVKPQPPKTPADLLAFYEAAPVSKYCFLHGHSNHSGKDCKMMLSPKSTFTPAQINLRKPKYVNGKPQEVDGRLPKVTFAPGFRHED